jgi:hypothetical protein
VDYLQETNPAVRWVAALALGLASLILGVLALGGAVACMVADLPPKDGVPARAVMLPFAAAFGLVAGFLGAMARRLRSTERSANGVTLMPAWFISGFGVLFFAGLVWAAIRADAPFMLVECGIVALAMVLVGRLARAKRQAAADDSFPRARTLTGRQEKKS